MNPLNDYLKVCLPLAAMLAAAAGGCQSGSDADESVSRKADDFIAPGEVSHVTRIADRQIASGVRTDATLRPYHFNEASLNSLGREKLDFMLNCDESDALLVVYVDAAAGDSDSEKDLTRARHESVVAYLLSRGMTDSQFRLESGYNSNNTVPVVSVSPPKGDAANAAAAGGAAKGSYGSGKAEAQQK